MANWNPWHGCRKYSEGCQNCYVYRIDSAHGKDASQIFLNREFDLPMRRGRKGYLLAPGTKVYTCFSSDFFWRKRTGGDRAPGDDALAQRLAVSYHHQAGF